MPNEHGVYMHDTPMKPLFNQRGRAFSAGCVRVQDVFTLAEWVARYEPGWEQPGRAQQIVDAGQPVESNLTRPVPVYFAYITAWAEPDGARSSSARTSTAATACATWSPATTAIPAKGRRRRGRWRPDGKIA